MTVAFENPGFPMHATSSCTATRVFLIGRTQLLDLHGVFRLQAREDRTPRALAKVVCASSNPPESFQICPRAGPGESSALVLPISTGKP